MCACVCVRSHTFTGKVLVEESEWISVLVWGFYLVITCKLLSVSESLRSLLCVFVCLPDCKKTRQNRTKDTGRTIGSWARVSEWKTKGLLQLVQWIGIRAPKAHPSHAHSKCMQVKWEPSIRLVLSDTNKLQKQKLYSAKLHCMKH